MEKILRTAWYFSRRVLPKTFLFMKLTAILLLVTCLQISATGYSQKVTLTEKNARLGKVFRAIKKQTGYSFFFDESWIQQAAAVNIQVKDAPLEKVLDLCFKNQPLTYAIVGNTVVVKQKEQEAASPETRISTPPPAPVKGVVKDADQNVLQGVSVRVKGTNKGTTTNANGEYSLVAEPGEVLVFTFIGFQQTELTVGKDDIRHIVMKMASNELGNIVVTALGITKKDRKLGYAVSTVNIDEIRNANNVSPITALQGKVAGVNINVMGAAGVQTSPSIIIRGAKSLTKNNQPIFVIDGMVLMNNQVTGDQIDEGSQLKNLNPDDYESMTVLKGAAATSLYGSRGANGAIVITTKKGKAGQGLGVSYNSTYQTQVIYENGLPLQNVYGSGAIAIREGNFKPDGSQVSTSFSFGPKMDGSMHPSIHDATKMVPYSPQPNNWKTFFQNGRYINNNVALSGGNEQVTYRFSYSNLRNDGTLPNNRLGRNNFDFRTTGKINKVFSVEAGASYAITDVLNPYGQGRYFWDSGQNLGFLTYYSVPRNTDLADWKANYRNEDGSMKTYQYAQYDNVVRTAFNRFDNLTKARNEKSLLANVLLKAQVTDWLDVSTKANFSSYRIFYENKEKGSGAYGAGGSYEVGGDYSSLYNYLFMIHGTRKLHKDLELDVRVVNEYYGNGKKEEFGARTDGGLIVPNVFTLSNSVNDIRNTRKYTFKTPNEKVVGVGGIVNLSYKEYLNLELTARQDWLSSLTYPDGVVGANNYGVFYPSVNVSWAFSDMWRKAMPAWLSFGKLRASVAWVGSGTEAYQTAFGTFTQGTVLDQDGKSVVTGSQLIQDVLPNLNLKPEIQRSIELGTNLSFLDDFVNLDFAWYKTNTFNQILTIDGTLETGYRKTRINAGNIQNQGIEVLLNVTPIRKKDLRLDLSLNFTRNRGTLRELSPGLKEYALMESYNGAGVYAYEGGAFGVLTATSHRQYDPKTGFPLLRVGGRNASADPEVKRDFQEYSWLQQPINAQNRRVDMGRVEPDFLGGFNANLRYKQFSLYVQLDGRFGGLAYSEAYNYGMQRGNLKNTMQYRDQENGGVARIDSYTGQTVYDGAIPDAVFAPGEKSPKTKEDIGGMTFREAYDKGLIESWKAGSYYINTFGWSSNLDNGSATKISWLMLREITLGYQVPKNVISKIRMKGAGVRFTARNIVYLYNGLTGGQNPESLQSNNPFNPVITGAVPFSRNYALSVNINL
ncbi:SusC/RagA family TonB-linked outer membrane protein [Chitinophaga nivalis]|uniref:SusC/RagA family TonB-linked outer membrane protein n=1 Tax=Chitinophaga nivalis TaxID=2991709 RepID=A0ABT3ISG4_9BACT|nr:SusC/RagA family TonB-linked outer membrane protein [Chitinophaga nivalis]MCW3463435.1 SusC/RagA family TonB-linked outer membrane protein [Chitinophaga nivalis]MCW3486875.1 SusC/RagA family TonB-linked outer membrane protein [Chitinophaga nivalis]